MKFEEEDVYQLSYKMISIDNPLRRLYWKSFSAEMLDCQIV